jgi:predicted dehydrogenase
MPSPVSVGLVGAGPWASLVHAPMLASGPSTSLAGVWARRPEAAGELADRFGVRAFDSYEALLDACSAVGFAVPPAVQVDLASLAAARGRHVLLEKPIADTLDGARRLVAAVDEAGVGSQVLLTWRYSPAVRAFLDALASFEVHGGRGVFLSGGLLGGMFATPWRLERGPLLDLGPHVIDLLDAALGRVVGIRAHGESTGWVGLLLDHEGGQVSEASLCSTTALEPSIAGVEVFGPSGALRVDCAVIGNETFAQVAAEFAETARRGGGHPLDVHRGLALQELIDQAEHQILGHR